MDSEFAALGAPAALAAALAEREYTTPTGVQALVLGAPDEDLLVSSQTGSGKTVAFGLLVGRRLLGGAERMARGKKPRALVITPTRELASQVQKELQWLLGPTAARVAAFYGGTDIRQDHRTLAVGAEVVVGTPGRLADLTTRKSLDLSAIEVVVLDEADEMLDMGFREELEAVLGQAPEARRTLLFSATLPPEIRALARRFQKSPRELDPRSGMAAQPHADIEHVAHLCADGERVAALVNVLLVADDQRAVVFCRTRDNVADLHHRLAMRGFATEAISGERAQEARTRALEALREGRVRVLVATDVAARGLDLPELGLVIHADLPESADSLTHRSGRTGRAGRKGKNVLLVERGQQRRAERLLAAAGLRVPWTAVPSAEAVAKRESERLVAELSARRAQPVSATARALAESVRAAGNAEEMLAVILERLLDERPRGEKVTPVTVTPRREREHAGKAAGPGARAGKVELFSVNLGGKDRAEATWILPLVCRRGGITRRDVGAIRVARDRTLFEVSEAVAAEFFANASEPDPRAPHVKIERAEGATLPSASRPKHPLRRAPPKRPPSRKP